MIKLAIEFFSGEKDKQALFEKRLSEEILPKLARLISAELTLKSD